MPLPIRKSAHLLLLWSILFAGVLTLPAMPLHAGPQADEKDPAIKLFKEGNEISAKGVELYNAGKVPQAMKEFPKAIEAYKKAIKINDKLPAIHYNLANVYSSMNKIDEAIKEYNLAIAIDPLNPEYHRNLGFAYAIKGDGDKAKQKYEALKAMSPKHADELMQWIKTENEQDKKNQPKKAGK